MLKHGTLLLAIALAAGCASTHGTPRTVNGVEIREDKPGLWARATLPPDSAIKIALARVPGGTISEAELEEENGRLIYSIELKVARTKGEDERCRTISRRCRPWELDIYLAKVHIDAATGEVVKQEHDD